VKRISILIAGILSAPVYADYWSDSKHDDLERQQRQILYNQQHMAEQQQYNQLLNEADNRRALKALRQQQPFNTESVWDEEVIAE
jgi:hypothetical protein